MKNKTIYILLISSVVLIFVGWISFVLPKEIAEKVEQVRQYRTQEAQNKNLEYGNQLKENLQNIIDQQNNLQQYAVQSHELLSFIQSIEQRARAQNLEVTITGVKEENERPLEEGGNVKDLIMTLELTGEYENSATFLRNIAVVGKKLDIQSISVNITETDERRTYVTRATIKGILLNI